MDIELFSSTSVFISPIKGKKVCERQLFLGRCVMQDVKIVNSLSIVCFIHNISHRGYDCVRNFLTSLRSQEGDLYPQIIIVNMSTDDSFSHVDRHCSELKAMHVYCKLANPLWSKSLGLNIGLRHVVSEYTMFTDIDYIFQSNFISTAMNQVGEDRFLLCRTHDSTNRAIFDKFEMSQYESFFSKCLVHPITGDGACQIASSEWFRKIRGYDERMCLWGGMDNDMHQRAEMDEKKVIWLDGTSIIHQWHPKFKNMYTKFIDHRYINRDRMRENVLIKNEQGWGRLKITEKRDYNSLEDQST